MKKVHKRYHEEALELPEYKPIFVRIRFVGYAFFVMGLVLASLPFVYFYLQLNNSVADWVGSIFFHFIPGIVLLVSAFKVLRSN